MKKIFLFAIMITIGISALMAQVPQAFKYQAVVRDHNGSVITDQNINLRISILYGGSAGEIVYSETHPCNTNSMGLVNLEIGRGFNPSGSIPEINWAAGDFYVKVEMDEHGGTNFEPMGVAQLLSVPYALHSGTAEGIAGDDGDGVPANNWILFGNSNTNPGVDKLGTTDAADLVVVTDDIERMRVLSDGDINIINSANVGMNLTVEQNVNLNTFSGETNNYGPFTVANLSPTLLSGILTVDLHTDLNSSLNVDGITDLNSAFNVNNESPSLLTGTLLVKENATFEQHVTLTNPDLDARSPSTGALVVAGGTGIGGNLYVGDSVFFDGPLAITNLAQSFDPQTGALTVAGGTGIAKRLNVGGATMIDSTLDVNGQMTINATLGSNSQSNYNDYPLRVQGGNQGIAIKVNGSRGIANNYVSFWDSDGGGTMWGRIEGITVSELHNDPEYLWEHAFKITDIVTSSVDFAIAGFEVAQAIVGLGASLSSSTACVGFGACVTAPIPAFIISAGTNLALKIANAVSSGANLAVAIADEVTFNVFLENNIGVSYQSGAGDYAEWLPKLNKSDVFAEGELVGVTNGFVSKNTWGAEKVMIVSTNPIILGNMPQQPDEKDNVKIAFIGQVPARILGEANPGDYVLPNILGNGFGVAVKPGDMKTSDYKKVAGVVWSVMAEITPGVNVVNVAVGINTNDLSDVVSKQEEELKLLRSEMDQLNGILASLVPGFADAAGISSPNDTHVISNEQEPGNHAHDQYNVAYSDEDDILYFEISREQIEASLDMAREIYLQAFNGGDISDNIFLDEKVKAYLKADNQALTSIDVHPFWQKIDSDPSYKEEIVRYIKSQLEGAVHTHKKYAHKFSDYDLHE